MPCCPYGEHCSCCPYGCSYTLPMIFTACGTVASWFAYTACYYFEATQTFHVADDDSNEMILVPDARFGMGPWWLDEFKLHYPNGTIGWNFEGEEDADCKRWGDHPELDKDDLDGAVVFTRVVTFMAAWLALFCSITLLFGACMPLNLSLHKSLVATYVLIGVLTILSLVMLASDWCADADSCNISFGGVSAIIGSFFWLLAAFFTRFGLRLQPNRLTGAAAVVELPPHRPEDGRVAPEPLPTVLALDEEGNKTAEPVVETDAVLEEVQI